MRSRRLGASRRGYPAQVQSAVQERPKSRNSAHPRIKGGALPDCIARAVPGRHSKARNRTSNRVSTLVTSVPRPGCFPYWLCKSFRRFAALHSSRSRSRCHIGAFCGEISQARRHRRRAWTFENHDSRKGPGHAEPEVRSQLEKVMKRFACNQPKVAALRFRNEEIPLSHSLPRRDQTAIPSW